MRRRLISWIGFGALGFVALGCGAEPEPTPVTVSITPTARTFNALGDTATLTARTSNGGAIVWSSTAPLVASVTGTGLVTALAQGAAEIVATAGTATARSAVTVAQTVARIDVLPADTIATAIGDTILFRSLAVDAGGSPVPGVTDWTVDTPGSAIIGSTGIMVTLDTGLVAVRATRGGTSGTARATVQQRAVSITFQGQPPLLALADDPFTIDIAVADRRGALMRAPLPVGLALLAPSGATGAMTGPASVSAAGGVARFIVAIDRNGLGYVFKATAAGLGPATSLATDVGIRFASLISGSPFCGRDSHGILWCWGHNDVGELGTGDAIGSPAPRRAALAGSFAVTRPQTLFGCGLNPSGRAQCWGFFFGAAGGALVGGRQYQTLSGGIGSVACGITATGSADCWGQNVFGELGAGFASNTMTMANPVPVAGGLRFRQISAGSFHVCGIADLGATYCWGWNQNSQLGTGDTVSSPVPIRIANDPGLTSLTAGTEFTCGLDGSKQVHCWGRSDLGQAGSGRGTNMLVPVATPLATQLRFNQISAGTQSICGIATDASAYCWGVNFNGELGTGSNVPFLSAVPLKVKTPEPLIAITAGELSACGLSAKGQVYCWGYEFTSDGHFSLGGPGVSAPVRLSAAP